MSTILSLDKTITDFIGLDKTLPDFTEMEIPIDNLPPSLIGFMTHTTAVI